MSFPPQRRAPFRHLNFQKCSEHGVLCTFWLGNVLRATTVCTFSSLIWPDGSAPAALASLLFDPPEPPIIGKTEWFATFFTFARICIFSFSWFFLFSDLLAFSLLFLLWLTLPTSAFFHLAILSEVWLLSSKLPSITDIRQNDLEWCRTGWYGDRMPMTTNKWICMVVRKQ